MTEVCSLSVPCQAEVLLLRLIGVPYQATRNFPIKALVWARFIWQSRSEVEGE